MKKINKILLMILFQIKSDLYPMLYLNKNLLNYKKLNFNLNIYIARSFVQGGITSNFNIKKYTTFIFGIAIKKRYNQNQKFLNKISLICGLEYHLNNQYKLNIIGQFSNRFSILIGINKTFNNLFDAGLSLPIYNKTDNEIDTLGRNNGETKNPGENDRDPEKNNREADNRETNNRGADNLVRYNRETNSRGADNLLKYNHETNNHGADNLLKYNHETNNHGANDLVRYNRETNNHGTYNLLRYNRETNNRESDNIGKNNAETNNHGTYSLIRYNRESDNFGREDNREANNRGTDNKGLPFIDTGKKSIQKKRKGLRNINKKGYFQPTESSKAKDAIKENPSQKNKDNFLKKDTSESKKNSKNNRSTNAYKKLHQSNNREYSNKTINSIK